MVLWNPKGTSWPVNVITSHFSLALCGGWRVFAHDNNIRIGDICIFELMGRLDMTVHIFPCAQGKGPTSKMIAEAYKIDNCSKERKEKLREPRHWGHRARGAKCKRVFYFKSSLFLHKNEKLQC